jgi:hypothetical protein
LIRVSPHDFPSLDLAHTAAIFCGEGWQGEWYYNHLQTEVQVPISTLFDAQAWVTSTTRAFYTINGAYSAKDAVMYLQNISSFDMNNKPITKYTYWCVHNAASTIAPPPPFILTCIFILNYLDGFDAAFMLNRYFVPIIQQGHPSTCTYNASNTDSTSRAIVACWQAIASVVFVFVFVCIDRLALARWHRSSTTFPIFSTSPFFVSAARQ